MMAEESEYIQCPICKGWVIDMDAHIWMSHPDEY